MLIIEIEALPNGAHRNQAGDLGAVPEGWARVPEELEEEAMAYLPFIVLTMQDGQITGVAQGVIPEPEPDPEPPAPVADPQADTDAMLVDHEYRITLLELGVIEN